MASNGQEIEVISNFVHDLLKNENVPSVLSVISCWPKADCFSFVQRSKISIQMSNNFQFSPRIVDDNVNKFWYFVDMRCNESYNFLQKIEDSYFAQPFRWILFEPVEDHLTNLTFPTDSNIILVNFNPNLAQFDLKQGMNYSLLHEI